VLSFFNEWLWRVSKKNIVKVNCVNNACYLEMELVKKCVIEVVFKFRVFMDPYLDSYLFLGLDSIS